MFELKVKEVAIHAEADTQSGSVSEMFLTFQLITDLEV